MNRVAAAIRCTAVRVIGVARNLHRIDHALGPLARPPAHPKAPWRRRHPRLCWRRPVGRVDHGDLSVTGDETATLFTYAQNDVAFLGDRVSLERTFAGTSSDGPLLRRTTRFYDGATSAATTR